MKRNNDRLVYLCAGLGVELNHRGGRCKVGGTATAYSGIFTLSTGGLAVQMETKFGSKSTSRCYYFEIFWSIFRIFETKQSIFEQFSDFVPNNDLKFVQFTKNGRKRAIFFQKYTAGG
jgi:hypothetical protein